MEVDNNGVQRISRPRAESARAVEKETRQTEGARPEGLAARDEATLSERARLLARARARLEETPEVRTDQVERLREAIDAGAYQVPVEALAQKLVARLRAED